MPNSIVVTTTDKLHALEIPLVTVVIATLGGDTLTNTIELLNRGTLAPAEILICIPQDSPSQVEQLSFKNVKIVRTACRGQVAQRAVGFQQASHNLVLQLDDDIFVAPTCLENLVACMSTSQNVAVGPKLYDSKTGKYHIFLAPVAGKNSWFEKLLFFAANGCDGYQPGQIAKAGINMGVPEESGDWNDLGWLAGGCVLHRKKNLVLFDYYPFKGKAFAEDLFHSALLKKKGIKLARCNTAICDVDFSSNGATSLTSFLRTYITYARAMTRFVKDMQGSVLRLYLYLVLNFSGIAMRKLLQGPLRPFGLCAADRH